MSVPRASDLFNPLLTAIKRLGGSASISELDEEVTKNLNLTEEEITQPHNDRSTELEYQLAWARSYLKAYGLLDNSDQRRDFHHKQAKHFVFEHQTIVFEELEITTVVY